MDTKEIPTLVIYENGERREIAEPTVIFENGIVIEYAPAMREGE